jgi:hypothetical protein
MKEKMFEKIKKHIDLRKFVRYNYFYQKRNVSDRKVRRKDAA